MITTKHASNSPVMFVTHESFAVLLFLPCCVNSLSIIGALFWTTILCNSRSLPWTILCIPHPFTWPYLRGAFVLASGVFITLLKGIQNRLYVCDACVSRSPHADDTRTVLFVPSLLLNYRHRSSIGDKPRDRQILRVRKTLIFIYLLIYFLVFVSCYPDFRRFTALHPN